MKTTTVLFVLLSVLGVQDAARAEDPPLKPAEALQLDIVVTRSRAEHAVSRLAYSILTSAGPSLELKIGVEVPVPAGLAEAGPDKQTSSGYRNVGMNVRGSLKPLAPGAYTAALIVELTGVSPTPAPGAASGAGLLDTLRTSAAPILHEGQKAQILSSTNPLTGEVTTIEVTLKPVK